MGEEGKKKKLNEKDQRGRIKKGRERRRKKKEERRKKSKRRRKHIEEVSRDDRVKEESRALFYIPAASQILSFRKGKLGV